MQRRGGEHQLNALWGSAQPRLQVHRGQWLSRAPAVDLALPVVAPGWDLPFILAQSRHRGHHSLANSCFPSHAALVMLALVLAQGAGRTLCWPSGSLSAQCQKACL